MNKKVNKIINELYIQSINDNDNYLQITNDSEYQEIQRENKKLLEELEGLIPEEKRNLLINYTNSNADLLAYEGERSYSIGFKDGANLIISLQH